MTESRWGKCVSLVFFSYSSYIHMFVIAFCLSLTIGSGFLFLQIFPFVSSSPLTLNSIRFWQKVAGVKRLWVDYSLKWLRQRPILVQDVEMCIVIKEVCSITWSGNVAKILASFAHTVPLSQNTNHLYRDILGDVIRTNFFFP